MYAPATHSVVPGLHSPTLEPHAAPPPGLPSSIEPLQLSSKLLQVSVAGPVEPTQLSAPLWHCSVPCLQVPTMLPQTPPPPGLSSSIEPLQLSSLPLHVSVLGSMLPVQTAVP